MSTHRIRKIRAAIATNFATDYTPIHPKRLIICDVDSTLIEEEVIDLLGAHVGLGAHIADITHAAMSGQMDFATALRKRLHLLKGMNARVFEEIYSQIHITDGARQLVETAQSRGWTVGAVSGGFMPILEKLAGELSLDHYLAHELEVCDGIITGDIVGPIITGEMKRQTLLEWAKLDGVDISDTVAVGDGANDIHMIRTAGIGIAFCAHDITATQAHYRIDTRDLAQVIGIIDQYDARTSD